MFWLYLGGSYYREKVRNSYHKRQPVECIYDMTSIVDFNFQEKIWSAFALWLSGLRVQLEESQKIKSVDKIIVSTDDKQIKKFAKKFNVDVGELYDTMRNQVPLARIGKPEEFGYLVTFLASEYASYINGANIPIDGGLLKSI